MTQLRMPLGMLQNPMGVLRGPPNMPRGPLNVLRGPLNVLRGPLGVLRGLLGVLRGPLGVLRGPLGVLRSPLGVCLPLLALFSCQPALGDHLRAFNLTEATFSNRTCFSCSLDFRYVPWQGDHPCLGWTEPVATDYLVQCGGHQPICQETWFVQSGILLLLSRGCTDSCAAYCKSTGFGVTRTTCNLCCERDGCNDHPPSLQATATGL